MKKKSFSKFIILLAGLLLLASYFLLPALAQEDPDFDRVNDIAKELNCPTCTGINLADCRTLTCEQWREQIGELVVEGYNDQEVLNYFSTRYGDQVLLEPPRRGFSLLIYILPLLALVGGGIWLVITLRKWRQEPVAVSANPNAPTAPKPDDDYLSQVEQDLGIDEA